MPFRRTTRRRRVYRRKGRKLTKRQLTTVKTLINRRIETKFFPYAATSFAVISTPILDNSWAQVPQGDSDTQRNGDHIMWKKLRFRYQLLAGDTTNLVRIIIFQWHPSSTPVPNAILLTGPSGGADVYSCLNQDTRQMYKIIYDKTHSLVGNGTPNFPVTSVSQTFVNRQFSLSKCQKNVQFNAGTTVSTNTIYLMFLSDSAPMSIIHPSMVYTSMLWYKDG